MSMLISCCSGLCRQIVLKGILAVRGHIFHSYAVAFYFFNSFFVPVVNLQRSIRGSSC